jgi:hypothetical protein
MCSVSGTDPVGAVILLRYFQRFVVLYLKTPSVARLYRDSSGRMNDELWTRNDLEIQSNLGSRTPRIIHNSVYEQIFRTQSVSDDVLCVELRTRKPSTSWSDKLGVSTSAVFVEEWSTGKYHESATPIGESVSCCIYLICLVLCLSFFVIDLMVSIDFVLRTCAQSTVVKV